MNEKKYCPECGHEFEQGEHDYCYEDGNTYYTCPECGWQGNHNQVIDGNDLEEEEIGELD